MKSTIIPSLDRLAYRSTAAGLLVAAIALVALLIVKPILEWHVQARQRLETAAETLARLEAIASYGSAQTNSANRDNFAVYGGEFLQGTDESLILADLQSRLRSTVVAAKAEFNSARTLPSRTAGQLILLGLRIQLRGEIKAVQSVIHAIEAAAPILFIDRMLLRLDERRLPVAAGSPNAAAPTLNAELDVYGARWTAKPSIDRPQQPR